jgi:hypothetical protein
VAEVCVCLVLVACLTDAFQVVIVVAAAIDQRNDVINLIAYCCQSIA